MQWNRARWSGSSTISDRSLRPSLWISIQRVVWAHVLLLYHLTCPLRYLWPALISPWLVSLIIIFTHYDPVINLLNVCFLPFFLPFLCFLPFYFFLVFTAIFWIYNVLSFCLLELNSAVGDLFALEKRAGSSGGSGMNEATMLAVGQSRTFLPSTNPTAPPNRYVSWGYPDRTLRVGFLETDRVFCDLSSNESFFFFLRKPYFHSQDLLFIYLTNIFQLEMDGDWC